MLLHSLSSSLVSVALFFTSISALVPATPPTPNNDGISLPGASPILPDHAPPQPWNQHACRNPELHPGLPEMHLTFSLGGEIPGDGAMLSFQEAKEDAQMLVSLGYGHRQVESPEYDMAADLSDNLYIKARRFQRRIFKESFTIRQAVQAVELLEYCWRWQQHRNEMWAYVF
ncbi:MAG: hypothetical protein Q9224_006663, partial [Gallowayella concinna]